VGILVEKPRLRFRLKVEQQQQVAQLVEKFDEIFLV